MPHPSSVPRTLTDRQEVFCRHVARGASGAAAARAAGYAPANAAQQGSSLLQQPHLRVRIEELRTRRESVRSIAVAEMTDMLRLLMRRAIKAGDHRAAIRCIEVEARLTGLFPDRLFDEMEDEEAGEPTPMNPEETPFFPMESSPEEPVASLLLRRAPTRRPAPVARHGRRRGRRSAPEKATA